MARKKNGERPGFGARLAALRKAAGYTQQELPQELGISRRMILDALIEREQLRATKG